MLARFCLGWSLSEGERERLRVMSASGMIREQVWSGSHSREPQGLWGVDETEKNAWELGREGMLGTRSRSGCMCLGQGSGDGEGGDG